MAEIPNAKDYGVTIVHPRPGDKVTSVEVMGTIKKAIPKGYKLWVFRVYENGDFWHLNECRISETGDEWTAAGCDIGRGKSKDREFSVNLVGPNGAALLNYADRVTGRCNEFRPKIERETGTKYELFPPGMKARPDDMVECKRVRVEREA